VPRNATSAEIKKAYHRLALACHPDKNPDDPNAKERYLFLFHDLGSLLLMLLHRFQQLAFVKDILTNEEKRRVYDGDILSLAFFGWSYCELTRA
jgi:DnaJ family protein C protein 9